MEYKHVPVMLGEVLEYLRPFSGGRFIDCTLGGGSYTRAIADIAGSDGIVVALDRDEMAIENAKKNSKSNNIFFVHSNYKDIQAAVQEYGGVGEFDGVVMDLGLSSAQLDDRQRGFSFLHDGPLDMGMGCNEESLSTSCIVNSWSESELRRIIFNYGEEKYASRISRAICAARREGAIDTTGKLLNIIQGAVPIAYVKGRGIHFATRTFQALRIATNQELESLETALPQVMDLLKPGGRVVVVSFHSLEDRIVKSFFKKESRECLCPPKLPVCCCGHKTRLRVVTKKIVLANKEELAANPRSRSAKLRAAEKI